MDVYHGTSLSSAKDILGPPSDIDVTKGRGELGRGFYAGSEPYMAASWARGRYKEKAAVLKISLSDEYLSLSVKIVRRASYLITHWNTLIRTKQTTTYLYGKDVVLAPFAKFDLTHQYKFESYKAESLLNRSKIKQMPL
jgi:hypothetical protein